MNTSDFIPPHDLTAEQAVLGSVLIDADAMMYIGDILTPAMFYRKQHSAIWQAMTTLHERREPLDILTVAAAVPAETKDVAAYLIDLMNAVPTSINADAYARIVADRYARRQLIELGGKVAKGAWDETAALEDTLRDTTTALMAIRHGRDSNPVQTAADSTAVYVDSFLERVTGEHKPKGITTGLIDVDRLLTSMAAPHQYLLAGRPGMGKSALALCIVLHALIRQNKRVLLFSLEMSTEQVLNRLIALMTKIPVSRLRQPWTLTEQERAAVTDAAGRLSQLPLYIDESAGLKPNDLTARATRVYMEHGLDLICVDHVGLMQPDRDIKNRVAEQGEISRALAATYKTLHVTGLTLCQLNRGVEYRSSKRPMLADLRDSGEHEQNAYAVMFVYRPGYYDEDVSASEAELIIAKHRDGETGTVPLYWQGEIMRYGNAAHVDLNPRANRHSPAELEAIPTL